MDELSFPNNHMIFAEGQEGRALYIVVSGRVKVHSREQVFAVLEKGTCFGEMSLFDAEPRSASITTLEPCDCLMLTQQQLYEAIDETPGIAINIIRLLSRRIRELNHDLKDKQLQTQDVSSSVEPRYQDLEQMRSPNHSMPYPIMDQPYSEPNDGNGNFPYSTFPY